MDRQRYLITGASGFIGSWVARLLVKEASVFAIVRPNSNLYRLNDIKDKIKIVEADLRDKDNSKKLVKKVNPDYILHLATFGVYPYQQEDVERIMVGNWEMAVNLFEIAKSINLKRFVNFGSVFEYGSRKGKVSEQDVDISDTLNMYSATKMATTALASAYKELIPLVTLRPFTTYGPYEDASRFIAGTIIRALNNEPIRIAPGVVLRDFVYVKDVARACILACKSKIGVGEIMNVGSGKAYKLLAVANLIKRLTSSKSKIIEDPKYIRKKESRCWADITKAKKLLRWSPNYSLKEALWGTIEWYKRNASLVPQLPTLKAG